MVEGFPRRGGAGARGEEGSIRGRIRDFVQSRFDAQDFLRMFGLSAVDELPPGFSETLAAVDTSHRDADAGEREAYALYVLKKTSEPAARRTPEENLAAWERGWGENLALVERAGVSEENLTPRYNRPKRYMRYDGGLVVSDNPHLEHDLFKRLRAVVFHHYLRPYPRIVEIGCGSCQNVLALARAFPDKHIAGFDWTAASVAIVGRVAEALGRPVEGRRFDLMAPPADLRLEMGTAVLTVHALEQIGARFQPFLDFIMRERPALVVHVEPVLELYDHDDLLDYLAWSYSTRRDYLCGYLTTLQALCEAGRAEIVDLRRTRLGGEIHEGNTVIAWRPLPA